MTNEPETALFPHLLQTKLAPPRKRSGAIERGELVNRLAATAALTTLTVVEAPAGWGKSTLLGQWLQATGRPERHAWFSLEETDNDPSIFWAYVVEAINRVEPGVGRGPARLLRAPGTTAVDHVVPSLLNALDQATDHITLVLDDYHLIGNDEIHYAMSFFVRHLPAVAHLAISTRTQPPLPIARLRTRGEVVELGIDDLRFTDEDARTLLERECGVALQPADVKLLHDRTEGWAAGLHLAALSLRGRPDLERLIDQFAGDDRLVVDYLMSEVLDRQPADIRQFLCRTAVLDRFCGPLCDAVTGETGSEATIERIEREQLFLIPLDNRRLWYRYHHLFGDLLRRELTRADPTLAVELHRRASAWFGDHDGPADAIKHAFLAGEARQAADLLSETYMYFLGEGQHDTVLGWFQQIPEDVIRSDGQLCMARALTLSMNGRLTDVEAWLVAAEQAPPVTAPLTGFFPSLEAAINLTRSTVQYSLGNVTEAERWSKRAHEVVPADGSEDRFLTSYVLGASAYRNGDLDTAVHWLERDAAWAEATGYHLLNVIALSHLGLIRVLQGRTGLARRLVTKGLAVSEAHGLDEHTSSALLHLVDGQLQLFEGRPESAVKVLRHALELCGRGNERLTRIDVLLTLSQAERQLGNTAVADAHASEARELIAICPDPGRMLQKGGSSLANGPIAPVVRPGGLTDRQVDVLRLVAQGLPNAAVAERLDLSERTVHAHLRAIFDKLGVNSRTAAARFAVKQNLA